MSARSWLIDLQARLTNGGGSERLLALVSAVRFGKFVSVGVVGAVFDITTLLVLADVVGVPAALANVFSIETAILVMFVINETWTFAEEGEGGQRSIGRRLVRSHMVRAVGSTLQWLVFVAVFYNVGVTIAVGGFDLSLAGVSLSVPRLDLWLVVVKGAAIGVAMLVNYVAESLFTWRVHAE